MLCGLVLLAANLLLALLHGAYFVCLRFGLDAWPRDPLFSLSSNAGLAQAFNSAQTLLLVALLLGLAQRTRNSSTLRRPRCSSWSCWTTRWP